MDVYLEKIALFNEKIINMKTKSMEDIVVLYPINTKKSLVIWQKRKSLNLSL